MGGDQEILIPYRLRTVRAGIVTTAIVLAWLLAYRHLPGSLPLGDHYVTVLLVAGFGATIVMLLPWERMFASSVGVRALYAWSAIDIVLVSWLVAQSGGGRSPLFGVYLLTTLFFVMSYPLRGQIGLVLFTAASYLVTLWLTGWGVEAASLLFRFAMLGTVMFMAGFLVSELMDQMRGHSAERERSEARARVMRIVAAAGRGMSTLDPDAVLAIVVDSARALGFDSSAMCTIDHAKRRYTPGHARNLPAEYTRRTHSLSTGVTGRVARERRTVVVEDYFRSPAAPASMRATGLTHVAGTPVWSNRDVAAVLLVGRTADVPIQPYEIEALEMLAAHAGRALDNARLYEEERRSVERLAELDRMKDDFLSTVSHELRTPLTVVEGIGLTLASRWEHLDDDDRLNLLTRLNRNAGTLDSIITTLLDFSRVKRVPEARTDAVQLGALADACVARLASLLEHHAVSVDIDEELIVVGDGVLLDRVLENLLANAAKHTPAGTAVVVRATADGDTVRVAVADDGPGVASEDRARIGERFFRGKATTARRVPGTGIGLALVREVLALHGTELNLSQTPGGGATFWFRLAPAELERRTG